MNSVENIGLQSPSSPGARPLAALPKEFATDILPVMKPVRTLLGELHDVVQGLGEPAGLGVFEELQDAEAPSVEYLHVLQQPVALAVAHPTAPAHQLGVRLLGILPSEAHAEVLLEDVGRVVGLVGAQPKQALGPSALPVDLSDYSEKNPR